MSSPGAATSRAASRTSTRTRAATADPGFRGRHRRGPRAPARRRARFVQHDWSNLVPALERGDFDIVLNGLEDTPERRARVLLERPVLRLRRDARRARKGRAARSLATSTASASATLNQTFAHDLLKTRSRRGRALRGTTGAVLRSRARAGRRGAARSRHRGSLRLQPARGSSACRTTWRAAST